MDIPEDDPRNPAVIADNVGDNVGDVAGMGADLFESFVGSIIAAITLANGDVALVMLPLWVSGGGICCLGDWLLRRGNLRMMLPSETSCSPCKRESLCRPSWLLHSALWPVGLSFQDARRTGKYTIDGHFWLTLVAFSNTVVVIVKKMGLFACIIIGLTAGVLIGHVTEYFTSYAYYPVKSITDAGITGPATVIIQGLGIGMISTVFPVLILASSILGCDALSGGYGVAMAAVGMLSTLGVTLATDAYGPVADNAGGIAEMAGLDERVRETTDALDALGNTTAATGKGFAIGSAVLTAISLLAAFRRKGCP
jgi:inorganic pyrophosphatase